MTKEGILYVGGLAPHIRDVIVESPQLLNSPDDPKTWESTQDLMKFHLFFDKPEWDNTPGATQHNAPELFLKFAQEHWIKK